MKTTTYLFADGVTTKTVHNQIDADIPAAIKILRECAVQTFE